MPKRVVIGGIIALAALAVVVIVASRQNQELYLTVEELARQPHELRSSASVESFLAHQAEVPSRRVRVRGTLIESAVQATVHGSIIQLMLAGGNDQLRVLYRGPTPDALIAGREVTVTGWLAADGTLVADGLTVQCPSKYEPQATGTATAAAMRRKSRAGGRRL